MNTVTMTSMERKCLIKEIIMNLILMLLLILGILVASNLVVFNKNYYILKKFSKITISDIMIILYFLVFILYFSFGMFILISDYLSNQVIVIKGIIHEKRKPRGFGVLIFILTSVFDFHSVYIFVIGDKKYYVNNIQFNEYEKGQAIELHVGIKSNEVLSIVKPV